MFWKFNFLTTSKIDSLLEKEDITLQELMNEDDILQECKAQNRKLIDFLIRPENLELMVSLITKEPKDDVDEKERFKYPNVACELLIAESQISDKIAEDESLINKLYSFIESKESLNPLLASFFSKVMGMLITGRSEMIYEFLKSKEDFIDHLMYHIGTSAIMDLLLQLIITLLSTSRIRPSVIEWVSEQRIVGRLVDCIKPGKDEEVHCNAAQSLCDIVRLGRGQISQMQDDADVNEPDPLLLKLEQEETISKLFSNMLDGEKNESVIVSGLSVIHTLLEFRRQINPENSSEQISLESENSSQGINNVLQAVTPRIIDFHNLLLDPPKQRYSAMLTTVGTLEPPLGNTRLQITRLVADLIASNSHSLNAELAKNGTTNVLIDLYYKYMWNNFLHTHVEQCIYTILVNAPIETDGQKQHPLLNQLFSESNLIQKIIDSWEENDRYQNKEKGRRRGYMGHSTKISNHVVNIIEKGENAELIKEQINNLSEEYKLKWDNFVNETLAEVNKKNSVELFKGQALVSTSEEEDTEFRDIPFPQDTTMQQLQQMTSNFIDQFGFNEEEFAEQEEKMDAPFTDRISSIDFNIHANEDNHPNSTMFEQACNERIQQFDDNDSDEEDIWEEREISFSEQTTLKRQRLPESHQSAGSDDSTDSEEDLDSPKKISQQLEKMDVDSNEAWTANFEDVPMDVTPIAMENANPWETNGPSPSKSPEKVDSNEKWANFSNKVPEEGEEKWADFTTLNSVDSADFNITEGLPNPRSSSPVAMETFDNSLRANAYLADSGHADLASSAAETVIKSLEENGDSKNLLNEHSSSKASPDVPSSNKSHRDSLGESNNSSVPEDSNSSSQTSFPHVCPTTKLNSLSNAAGDSVHNASSKVPDHNFLSSSGLMKSQKASSDSPSRIRPAKPVDTDNPDSDEKSQADINVIRTQAKEAMGKYEKSMSSASVQNGPV